MDVYLNNSDIYQISTQSNSAVIKAMSHSFSRFSVPQDVFLDNAPCFA